MPVPCARLIMRVHELRNTPSHGLQAYLVEELFFSCTNERLFKISRQNDPPFYTASVRKYNLTPPTKP